MKYPKLQKNTYEHFSVTDFSGGISPITESGTLKRSINTGAFGKGIKTRNSITANENMVHISDKAPGEYFTLTDAVIMNGGVYTALTSLWVPLGNFSHRYEFKLYSVDGSVTDAASLEFIRGEDGSFRVPTSLVCFTAQRKSGCGIYAFVSLHTSKAYMYDFEVYELSSDFTEWLFHPRESFYTPDYYINGRGNNWDMCVTDLPEPKYKEPLNLLSGIANCYFTTDGASTAFFLPISDLITTREDYLKVDLQADLHTHLQFTIPYGERVSNSLKYGEYELKVVYHDKFILFESNPSGFAPARLHGCENNLKVTLKHETLEDYHKKADMTLAGWYNFSGSGSRLLLAGNSEYPSLLAVSAENDPFYIPHTNMMNVGNGSSKITAILEVGGSALVIKENETYMVSVKSGKVSAELLSGSVGAKHKKAAKATGKGAIFVGADNKVYAMLSGGKIKEISARIEECEKAIQNAKDVFACATADRYILFCDRTAFVLHLEPSGEALNSPVWHEWNLPTDCRFLDGIAFGSQVALVGLSFAGGSTYYYAAVLSDDKDDTYYPSAFYELCLFAIPICTTITTHAYSLDNSLGYKSVNRVLLEINGYGTCYCSFEDENGDIVRSSVININDDISISRCLRLLPFVRARKCALTIQSENPIALNAIDFEYHKISD